MYRTGTGRSMNNLLSYCGLVDVRINASDKDLPVPRVSNSNYVGAAFSGGHLEKFNL